MMGGGRLMAGMWALKLSCQLRMYKNSPIPAIRDKVILHDGICGDSRDMSLDVSLT
jgi:hypothetical protein